MTDVYRSTSFSPRGLRFSGSRTRVAQEFAEPAPEPSEPWGDAPSAGEAISPYCIVLQLVVGGNTVYYQIVFICCFMFLQLHSISFSNIVIVICITVISSVNTILSSVVLVILRQFLVVNIKI